MQSLKQKLLQGNITQTRLPLRHVMTQFPHMDLSQIRVRSNRDPRNVSEGRKDRQTDGEIHVGKDGRLTRW